jgi:hypothetical protein
MEVLCGGFTPQMLSLTMPDTKLTSWDSEQKNGRLRFQIVLTTVVQLTLENLFTIPTHTSI